MNARSFLLVAAFMCGFVGSASADLNFGTPISESQTGPNCSTPGYSRSQYHTEWNADFSKYHMGEDLNGMCGGDTDEGYPIRAIADGQVVFLDDVGTVSGQGKRLYIRHSFPYVYAPNSVMTLDIAMLHLQGMASGISWTQGNGSVVTEGQTVAYLGKTGTTVAHLHWEAQTDLSIPLGTNPYQNPLTKAHALKYRAPSLMVDDRRDSINTSVPADGYWHTFTMSGYAPSSTMHVVRNGERKTLANAIAAGWIPSYGMIHKENGTWYYYSDVNLNFFQNGVEYGFQSLVSGVSFHVLVPRNGYQSDRARIDMIHAVENDSRFVSVKTETYGTDPNWDASWELHWMAFNTPSGDVYVNQATNKTNRLERYTAYYDPNLGQWTDWVDVGWNHLY